MNEQRRVAFDTAAYVKRSQSGACFACLVAAGRSPRREFVVYRDDQHIAFLPNFHVQRGYVLVAPIEHREGVVADVTLEEHLAAQTLVHAVGRALTQTVPTERIYVLSLGSQQGNAHVHWHVVALPPGVPYEQQQLVALTSEHQGVLDFPDDERSQMALELGHRIERELHMAT